MNIRGPFHHVHLLSENPELTVRWYAENLGGRVFDEGNVRGSMRFRLRLGDAQINIRGPRPGETIVPRGDGKSVGIDHFGLSTDKLEALLKQLKVKGARIVEPIFATPAGGRAFFIEAPDGVLIEIMEVSYLLARRPEMCLAVVPLFIDREMQYASNHVSGLLVQGARSSPSRSTGGGREVGECEAGSDCSRISGLWMERFGLRAMRESARGEPIVASGLDGPAKLSASPRVGQNRFAITASSRSSPR